MQTYVSFIYSNFTGEVRTFQDIYPSAEDAAYWTLYNEGFEPETGKTLDEYEQFAFDCDHALGVHQVKSWPAMNQ